MADLYKISEKPKAKEIYMLAGWRQWVDGGSVSSGLPRYLRKQTNARKIGELHPDGYYIFQLPGAHYFMRPLVRHNEGYPEMLQSRHNDFYYTEIDGKGVVFFEGEEPHLDVERYTRAFLEAARELNVKRIVIYGGIYAEVPYDRERFVTTIFSLENMRAEISDLVVNLSSYQGPGSIGSYICKRAGEQGMEVAGLYTFSPVFQIGGIEDIAESIHIKNDYMAWLGVLRRTNHFLGLDFDLSDLENLSDQMITRLDAKVTDLDSANPELGIRDYFQRLSDDFEEETFTPLEDVWQDELRRLGDKYE